MDTEKTYDLELAQRLFREYFAICFWHMKPDLFVRQVDVPAILKGMRTYGGRRGWFAAATLAETAEGERVCR